MAKIHSERQIAGWFEYYAESLELNVWNNTELISAEFQDIGKWDVKVKKNNKDISLLKPKHIVMAIGVSSIPKILM